MEDGYSMKKIIYMLIAAVFALVSCTKDNSVDISGEWYGTKMISKEKVADIYLSFSKGRFVIYQKTGDQTRFYKYEGSYTVSGDVLTGKYDDGTPMAVYIVIKESDSLILTADNGSDETIVYVSVPVPSEVKDTAVPPVKSADDSEILKML